MSLRPIERGMVKQYPVASGPSESDVRAAVGVMLARACDVLKYAVSVGHLHLEVRASLAHVLHAVDARHPGCVALKAEDGTIFQEERLRSTVFDLFRSLGVLEWQIIPNALRAQVLAVLGFQEPPAPAWVEPGYKFFVPWRGATGEEVTIVRVTPEGVVLRRQDGYEEEPDPMGTFIAAHPVQPTRIRDDQTGGDFVIKGGPPGGAPRGDLVFRMSRADLITLWDTFCKLSRFPVGTSVEIHISDICTMTFIVCPPDVARPSVEAHLCYATAQAFAEVAHAIDTTLTTGQTTAVNVNFNGCSRVVVKLHDQERREGPAAVASPSTGWSPRATCPGCGATPDVACAETCPERIKYEALCKFECPQCHRRSIQVSRIENACPACIVCRAPLVPSKAAEEKIRAASGDVLRGWAGLFGVPVLPIDSDEAVREKIAIRTRRLRKEFDTQCVRVLPMSLPTPWPDQIWLTPGGIEITLGTHHGLLHASGFGYVQRTALLRGDGWHCIGQLTRYGRVMVGERRRGPMTGRVHMVLAIDDCRSPAVGEQLPKEKPDTAAVYLRDETGAEGWEVAATVAQWDLVSPVHLESPPRPPVNDEEVQIRAMARQIAATIGRPEEEVAVVMHEAIVGRRARLARKHLCSFFEAVARVAEHLVGIAALRAFFEAIADIMGSQLFFTRQIDQLLAEDAVAHPRGAEARRLSVLRFLEGREITKFHVNGIARFLHNVHRRPDPNRRSKLLPPPSAEPPPPRRPELQDDATLEVLASAFASQPRPVGE